MPQEYHEQKKLHSFGEWGVCYSSPKATNFMQSVLIQKKTPGLFVSADVMNQKVLFFFKLGYRMAPPKNGQNCLKIGFCHTIHNETYCKENDCVY
jgi:hypothetical protein